MQGSLVGQDIPSDITPCLSDPDIWCCVFDVLHLSCPEPPTVAECDAFLGATTYLPLILSDLSPSTIAASMGCSVPTTSDSGAPSSTSTSSVSPQVLLAPALLQIVTSWGTTLIFTPDVITSWVGPATLGTSSPSSVSLPIILTTTSVTSSAHSSLVVALPTSAEPTPSSDIIISTSSPDTIVSTSSPVITFASTTFTSVLSPHTVIPNSLSVSTCTASTCPLSSTTSAPMPEGTIVAASIGGTLGVVALLAVFITIYFRCRSKKPVTTVVTPYYETAPASPRRPFTTTTVQPEIKFGLTTHAPLTSITAQGSAPSQHRRFSLTTTHSECDVDGDNSTLCVPEDKSAAARRRRECELEKLYPIRPRRANGEYGTGPASMSTESFCVDSESRL
ncbi:hypothetical protein BDN67DRAFT_1008563 [Paxillus ammoniavirescens]|nr:hypothetical protein BDN67DRAFT_1008563 [Paxillus ammoniavirescens]